MSAAPQLSACTSLVDSTVPRTSADDVLSNPADRDHSIGSSNFTDIKETGDEVPLIPNPVPSEEITNVELTNILEKVPEISRSRSEFPARDDTGSPVKCVDSSASVQRMKKSGPNR